MICLMFLFLLHIDYDDLDKFHDISYFAHDCICSEFWEFFIETLFNLTQLHLNSVQLIIMK